jgi:hypothetical protein
LHQYEADSTDATDPNESAMQAIEIILVPTDFSGVHTSLAVG